MSKLNTNLNNKFHQVREAREFIKELDRLFEIEETPIYPTGGTTETYRTIEA